MNGEYNRPLTLTDFLYLIVLYLGINSLLTCQQWQIYILFTVISLSLIVDWTSAFTMSPKASKILLISDILTSINYLCLYQATTSLEFSNTTTFVRYFFHYAIVFIIYSIWNIFLLIKTQATQETANFLKTYTIVGIVFSFVCLISFVLVLTNIVSTFVCLNISWVICLIHFLELFLWLWFTFFKPRKK